MDLRKIHPDQLAPSKISDIRNESNAILLSLLRCPECSGRSRALHEFIQILANQIESLIEENLRLKAAP